VVIHACGQINLHQGTGVNADLVVGKGLRDGHREPTRRHCEHHFQRDPRAARGVALHVWERSLS